MLQRKKLTAKTGVQAKALGVLALFAAAVLLLFFSDLQFLTPQKTYKNLIPIAAAEMPGTDPAGFFRQLNSESIQPVPRPLFPFSVIPRGIASAQELKTVLAHDPVATAHYAGFSIAGARVVKVETARPVYVSYRVGSHIYWTKNRMWLRPGETLISDGSNSARTRCGNRVSDGARLPVMAHEPPMKMLEEPAPLPEPQFDEYPLYFAPLELAGNGEPPPPGSSFVPPPSGGSGPPIGCCGVLPPPGKPPVTTPEPQIWLLLVLGGLILSFFRKNG